MKPMKRGSNPPGWAHPRSWGRPALERCPAGVQRQLWHRPGAGRARATALPAGQHPRAPAAVPRAWFGTFWVRRGCRSLEGEGHRCGGLQMLWQQLDHAGGVGHEVPEHPSASQSIPAQPEHPSAAPPFAAAGGGGPCQPSAPHLAFFPPPQTSTSARSTAPATTSASTPPGASSASATRATRCTASPTAEVGPGGCWVPTSPMGSGSWGEALGTPRNGAAPRHGRCGPLGAVPKGWFAGSQGGCPVSPPCTRCRGGVGRAHAARGWCLRLQTGRQEQLATCLQRRRGEKSPAFLAGSWDGVGRGTSKGAELGLSSGWLPRAGACGTPGCGEQMGCAGGAGEGSWQGKG